MKFNNLTPCRARQIAEAVMKHNLFLRDGEVFKANEQEPLGDAAFEKMVFEFVASPCGRFVLTEIENWDGENPSANQLVTFKVVNTDFFTGEPWADVTYWRECKSDAMEILREKGFLAE